jgi:hypothetical protein
MQLKLYTPKPEQALQQTPELRTAVTAEWLEQLPMTNPEEAAQKLLAELGRLNRAELDDDLRSKLTPLYEPVVQKLIEALVTTLPENGTPQSTVHRQAANLAYELALELTYAWKLAYLGVEQRRSLFGGAKARQNALTHLLDALSGQICTSYRIYTSPPIYSWHELHQVHEVLRQETITNATKDNPGPPPSEAVYKRALLLALADPFRFTRPEIEVTLAYLDKFGHLALLARSGKGHKSLFLINIDADTPFSHDIDPGKAASLVLDTHALCKHLRSLIVKLKTGEAFRDIGLTDTPQNINGLHLLSRLHQAWRGNIKRGFNRYEPGLTYVEVISGIPAVHRWLDPKQKPASGSSPGAKNVATGLADQGLPVRWRVVNDSACGLAISAHAQEVAQVRMGNPIALREENAEGEGWTLAVIRWGKMSKGQVVVAGVEKLSPSASPVVLRFLHGNAPNIGQPALLIPANSALQTEERLLLPQGLYQRARIADMWHNGERRKIGLGSLVEQTPFFDLVEVDPA